MLIGERHMLITEMLSRDGKVVITELSKELGVSIDTIRRDLEKLAEQGVLRRTHGGAMPFTACPDYTQREKVSINSKDKLAAETVKLLSDGQVIFLDAGTTNLQVARQIPVNLQATVVTNNLPAAMVLMEHPGIELIVTGGYVAKKSRMTSGSETISTYKAIYADVCIMGICSLHVDKGVCIPSYTELDIKRAMIEQSGLVIAPALAEKIGNIYTYKVDDITCLTHLITESHAPEKHINAFRERNISVTLIDAL